VSSSREFCLGRRKWATSSKEACHLKPRGFRLNRRQRQQINYESIAIALIIYFVKMYDTTCSGSLLYGEPNLQTIGRDVHCFFHIMLSEMSSNKLNMGIYQTPCGRQIWLFPPSRTLIVVVAEDEEERVDHVPMVIYNGPFCTWPHHTPHLSARLGLTHRLVRNCGLVRTMCPMSIMMWGWSGWMPRIKRTIVALVVWARNFTADDMYCTGHCGCGE